MGRPLLDLKSDQLFARFSGDIAYIVATILTSMVALFGSIIAVRYLTPEELGIIQTLMLIPVYLSFLHLGVFNGLNRNISFFTGRGDREKIQDIVNSSWTVAKYAAMAGVGISTGFTVYFLLQAHSSLYIWGMAFVFIMLLAEPFSQHMEVVYLSTRNFRILGNILLLQNFIVFLGNLLPALLGALGMVASRIVYTMMRFIVRWWRLPFSASGSGSFREIRELSVTGLPLLIAGTLYTYVGVADRSVVAFYLGPEAVGHYALTGLVVMGIHFIPQCIATLFYPRVAAHYGRTNSSRQLRRYFWIILWLTIAAVLPLCLMTYFLIGPVIRQFLPDYVKGIEAAQIACLTSLTFVYYGVASIIAVVRRNTLYIIAMALSLALIWFIGAYFVKLGFGIKGVIVARGISTSILCLFTIVYSYIITSKDITP